MKYKALKTVVRHIKNKQTTVLKLGETYSQEDVDDFPKWYLEDQYLIPLE